MFILLKEIGKKELLRIIFEKNYLLNQKGMDLMKNYSNDKKYEWFMEYIDANPEKKRKIYFAFQNQCIEVAKFIITESFLPESEKVRLFSFSQNIETE